MSFTIKDKIYCKIRGNSIVGADADKFDIQLLFEIIGKAESKYLILIPPYLSIKGTYTIKEEHISKFHTNPDFLDFRGMAVGADRIVKFTASSGSNDGMFCSKCQEFHSMAQSNQVNGEFICYQCRTDPWR